MRLFIALNIPEEIKEKFALVTKRLKYRTKKISWVKEENFHITLKFLGEVKEERLPAISEAASRCVKEAVPFKVLFSGLGAFPDTNNPRIIWAGVKDGAAELSSIAASIEESFEKLGFAKEKRPFSSHLTLGRVRSSRAAGIPPEELGGEFGSFTAEKIDLMQSMLEPSVPEYKCVETFVFGGKKQ